MIRRLAPETTALAGDPVGLLIEPEHDEVGAVCVCLDATRHVLRTAVRQGARLIVAHHPLIYHPLKRLDRTTPTACLAIDIVRLGVGLYAMHTNWDTADGGINDTLAERLGLMDASRVPGSPEAQLARVGHLPCEMELQGFIRHIGRSLNFGPSSAIRYAAPDGVTNIKRVAVCGGAGAMLVDEAIRVGADALVTADVRHHEFLDAAARGIVLVDAGHEATEAPGMQELAQVLSGLLPAVAVSFCPNQPAEDGAAD